MANINHLPAELVVLLAQALESPPPSRQATTLSRTRQLGAAAAAAALRDSLRSLAAFGRTSRKFFNIVDPILYKLAKTLVSKDNSWHPLRWSAETGQTGTLKKCLAADFDPNTPFDNVFLIDTIERKSAQIRNRTFHGKKMGAAPDPDFIESEQWCPQEVDVDDEHQPDPRRSSRRNHPLDPAHHDEDFLDYDEESNDHNSE